MERIGHGVGLDPHEPPSIEKGTTAVIEEGMVLTVEPIFWDKPAHELGNFAIEDMVVVTATGAERISTFPRELHVVA
jgi:Xaa-Pro dipeptidase